ncbi:YceD family protein [Micromonospora sp. WMMD1102]|uniref:YceD family protein n=1 Tax=Micromonospora sp. WMMD1102 TaxID=3016105 RepID=UPI0024154B11|nr:YceD family protein [Micromonospora sp. WMMD1102]MDG4785542.1 YceD family protein [Micromonospora sp. WMMD1102]
MPKHLPTHLNPRSPLVLDTRDLPRRSGVLRAVSRTVAAPADLGVELIGVPEGADLSLDLRLESVSEGVLVSGTVTGPIEGECGRCLRPITDSLTVPIQELYAYEHSTTDETTDEDEVGRMQGDLIDLEPALRDAVVLALPTNPVCREDCPGLCPECGVHWDELPAEHSHQQVDPRWAGLSQLTRQEE